jgi:hypothetical protein
MRAQQSSSPLIRGAALPQSPSAGKLARDLTEPVLLVGHADDPAEMALGMDPTQGMLENVELTDVIGDDHWESAKNTDRLLNRLIHVACNPP